MSAMVGWHRMYKSKQTRIAVFVLIKGLLVYDLDSVTKMRAPGESPIRVQRRRPYPRNLSS